MATYRLNEQLNGVEIVFDSKPADDIREALKAAGFRWGRGYWYAKQTPERLALAEELTNGKTESQAPVATSAARGTPQNRIRIYWNGFKLDGDKKMSVRVFYSMHDDGSIFVSARDYDDLPSDLFTVKNDTDIMTDYFCDDSTIVNPSHPLYKYIKYNAMKARARGQEEYIASCEKRMQGREPWPGHFESLKKDIARRRMWIAEYNAAEDPGQPTAEDLEAINRARVEAENARREAEHAAELAERERVLAERHEGFEYINAVAAQYPIEDGAPVVEIPFSENPAFYSFMVEDQKTITVNEDGTRTETITQKMPRCVLSVTAAEIVLRHFDEARRSRNIEEGHGGYYKTDFVITWTDGSGEPCRYEGRYDLGDNEGGLIAHMKAFAEWEKRSNILKALGNNEDEAASIVSGRMEWVELLETYNKPAEIGGAVAAC